jgi:hypothetical protein
MHKTLARVVNNYALAVVNFMIDENNVLTSRSVWTQADLVKML